MSLRDKVKMWLTLVTFVVLVVGIGDVFGSGWAMIAGGGIGLAAMLSADGDAL